MYIVAREQTDDQHFILGEMARWGCSVPCEQKLSQRNGGNIIVWTERLASKGSLLRELKKYTESSCGQSWGWRRLFRLESGGLGKPQDGLRSSEVLR